MNLPIKPLIVAAIIVAALINGAVNNSTDEPAPAREGPNPAVMARIADLTDCAALQAEFDAADRHNRPGVDVAYMRAADRRMTALGCYGP